MDIQIIIRNSKSLDQEAISRAYQQARTSFLVAQNESLDRFRISGSDRIDLLERLSTNTFKGQSDGKHLRTALLEANGRLIDLLDVFVFEDHLDIASSPNSAEQVLTWLRRHIFFQDDVTVERLDPWPAVIIVLGPQSKDLLQEQLGEIPEMSNGDFQCNEENIILPVKWPQVSAYRVFAQSAVANRLLNDMESQSPVPSKLAVEALRIEAGLPQRGREIRSGVIPLEVGLEEAISFSKGCYIGQEIIARLDSRGERAAILVGIHLSAPAAPDTTLEQAGKEIGKLTSCSFSPTSGWIGLGLIKTRRWDPSAGKLTIQGIPCRIQKLPFSTG